jgi:hypothetical protein
MAHPTPQRHQHPTRRLTPRALRRAPWQERSLKTRCWLLARQRWRAGSAVEVFSLKRRRSAKRLRRRWCVGGGCASSRVGRTESRYPTHRPDDCSCYRRAAQVRTRAHAVGRPGLRTTPQGVPRQSSARQSLGRRLGGLGQRVWGRAVRRRIRSQRRQSPRSYCRKMA